jgi:excisionase family DNA binding protein
VLTVAEASRLTGRDPETIRRWVRTGRLQSRRDGPRLLLFEDEVETMLTPPSLPLPAAWLDAPLAGQPDWVAYLRRTREGVR